MASLWRRRWRERRSRLERWLMIAHVVFHALVTRHVCRGALLVAPRIAIAASTLTFGSLWRARRLGVRGRLRLDISSVTTASLVRSAASLATSALALLTTLIRCRTVRGVPPAVVVSPALLFVTRLRG